MGENKQELLDLENQVNDYNKRRYTAEMDNEKLRHREFLQRQITLGNLEDKRNSPQISSDDLRKENDELKKESDIQQLLKVDDNVLEKSCGFKNEAVTPTKADDPPSETKSGKKKRRKKSILKKKNAQRKVTAIQDPPNIEITESSTQDTLKTDSGTSSQESTPSESEQYVLFIILLHINSSITNPIDVLEKQITR